MKAVSLETGIGRDLDATGARVLFEALGELSDHSLRHSIRVGAFAMRLGRALPGVSEEVARALGLAGTVHDVGKVHPRLSGLLELPRAFDEQEAKKFRYIHTQFGSNMLSSLQPSDGYEELVQVASFAALHHHDDMMELTRRNGTDPTMIMINNMIHVVDVFDAVQDRDRPYRPTPVESPEEAGALVEDELGIPPLFGTQPDEVVGLLTDIAA